MLKKILCEPVFNNRSLVEPKKYKYQCSNWKLRSYTGKYIIRIRFTTKINEKYFLTSSFLYFLEIKKYKCHHTLERIVFNDRVAKSFWWNICVTVKRLVAIRKTNKQEYVRYYEGNIVLVLRSSRLSSKRASFAGQNYRARRASFEHAWTWSPYPIVKTEWSFERASERVWQPKFSSEPSEFPAKFCSVSTLHSPMKYIFYVQINLILNLYNSNFVWDTLFYIT